MIIECPECGYKHDIDLSRLPKGKKIRVFCLSEEERSKLRIWEHEFFTLDRVFKAKSDKWNSDLPPPREPIKYHYFWIDPRTGKIIK
ncbi:MAG: hypothetical protein ACE5K4_00315 [Candidatus Hydrothermarchaeota archaeon]